MRTYRHNREAARRVEPEMCDDCGELSAAWRVTTWSPGWVEVSRDLCVECARPYVLRLRKEKHVFRVWALGS